MKSIPACYQRRFRSLFDEGRALAFPCDAQGHVDMDTLSPRALPTACTHARWWAARSACPPCCPSTCIDGRKPRRAQRHARLPSSRSACGSSSLSTA